jgi:hypothetical protein
MNTSAYSAIKLKEQSLKKRVHASTTDPIRRECDLGEASLLDKQSIDLITPPKPLKRGAGGEIIPPEDLGLSGLELSLKEPDLLDAEVTIKRTNLADKAGVFEMAIEAAESSKAKNSVQRMQAHQLALAHKYAMELMADASKQRDPIIKVKLMNCSARLMEAYSKGALALQRLQTGASQVVQVQHVQVNGQAVIGNVGGRV